MLQTSLAVSVRSVGELTQREYRQCYQLNFGHMGMMRQNLVLSRKRYPHEHVFMIAENDILLAWALVYDDNLSGRMPMMNKSDPIYLAHFYTRVSHRRMGLGRKLRQELERLYPEYSVAPWDNRSYEFYDNTEGESSVSYS